MSVIFAAREHRDAACGRSRAGAVRALCAAVLAWSLPAIAGAQRVPPARDAAAVRAELQRLDAALAESGAELARLDERVSAAREVVRHEGDAPLVVLLRVEPGATPVVSAAVVMDDAAAAPRRYVAEERDALRAGAADELLRTALLPGAHTVRATVTTTAGTVTRTASVGAPAASSAGRVTYLEFTLRGGRLDSAAWVADAPAEPRR